MPAIVFAQNARALRAVPGLGLCSFVAPSRAVERLLVETYASAETRNPHEFVDALVSHTLVSPRRLSYEEVSGLPEQARRELRGGCAEAADVVGKAGQGAPHASDDALLAAMVARYHRLTTVHAQPAGGLLGFLQSMASAWDAFGVRLHHGVRGADPVDVLDAWREGLDATLEELGRELTQIQREPLFFVVEHLGINTVRDLLYQRPSDVEELVSDYVIADRALLAQVEQAVADAPYLDEPQRVDLQRGIEELRVADPYACRRLLAGVEGALWLTAEAQGVIDSSRQMLRTGKPSPPTATSIGWLLRERGGLKPGKTFAWFLLNAVFTERANDIRHGRARSGHQSASVWSFVALLGWLDRYAGTGFMYAVTQRLSSTAETAAAA